MQIEQSVAGLFTAYAYENITVDATVGGVKLTQTLAFTPADPLGNHARLVVITTEAGDIRYSVLPSTPPVAGTAGHLLSNGSMLTIGSPQQLKDVRFIRETATSGVLRVTYYR